MLKVFDRVKIKAGAKIYSGDRVFPIGREVTQPFEVQIHRVLRADQTPDNIGDVVSWRSPGRLRDERQLWVEAKDVTLIQQSSNTDYP